MIIVTGASKGLGEAISKHLTENVEEVIGLSRSARSLDIRYLNCDDSDYKSVKMYQKKLKKQNNH